MIKKLFLILVIVFLSFSLANSANFYKLLSFTSQSIDEYSSSKVMTNNCTLDIFVPTKTLLEWDKFNLNKPSCMNSRDIQNITILLTSSQSWIVPWHETGSQFFIEVVGGGGGGGAGNYWGATSAGNGGTTYFGGYTSASGGQGGGWAHNDYGTDGAGGSITFSGYGSGGSGGQGFYNNDGGTDDGGWGGNGYYNSRTLSLTQGSSISVTIGSGGSGGIEGDSDPDIGSGSSGWPGAVRITYRG